MDRWLRVEVRQRGLIKIGDCGLGSGSDGVVGAQVGREVAWVTQLGWVDHILARESLM